MTKRRVVVRRKVYKPPKLPESPSVLRCKSYGLTKKGWQIIPRFVITRYGGKWGTRKMKKWWVIDMAEGVVARGSDEKGYPSKEAAREVAVKFREKYGVWTRIPF